jgi:hypothetical protein
MANSGNIHSYVLCLLMSNSVYGILHMCSDFPGCGIKLRANYTITVHVYHIFHINTSLCRRCQQYDKQLLSQSIILL